VKRSLAGALALALAAAALPLVASTYEEHLAAIAGLGPRLENGPGEAAALAYLELSLQKAGIPFSSSDFSQAKGGYSRSRILEIIVPGSRRDELVLVAPIGSWQDAVSGGPGAASLAFLLSEAERWREAPQKPPVSLRLVFLGAERRGRASDGEEASLGSATWIGSHADSTPRALLYLSLDPGLAGLALGNAGRGSVSPLWYFDRAQGALGAAGLDARVEAQRLQLYRLGLADRYGPEAPYLAAGIPAASLRSLPDLGAMPSMEGGPGEGKRLALFVDSIMRSSEGGFPESWDRHYLIFKAGRLNLTFREGSYVSFLIAFGTAAAALYLYLTVIRRSRAKAFLARLPQALGQSLLLYALLALVYLAGAAIARFDALALGSSEAWKLAPRVFAAARLLSSLLLFLSLVSALAGRRSLSANPFFYEFASLVCLGVDLLFFVAVNLPLSFPFLWALVFVAASLATKKSWASLGALAFMYAPALVLAADLAADPVYALYQRIVAPGPAGAFLLAALSLPFFAFNLSPLMFYAPRGSMGRRRSAAAFLAMAAFVEIGALAYASARAARVSREGFSISESVDQDQGSFEARLEAISRIGTGSISRGPVSLDYAASGGLCVLRGVDTLRRVSITQSSRPFLDRANLELRLSFARPPSSLRLYLRGSGELGIYDCGLPYRVALDGGSAEIFAPVNPGRELSFPITVPLGFSAELEVEAEYLEPLLPYAFPDGSSPAPGRFVVRARSRVAGAE